MISTTPSRRAQTPESILSISGLFLSKVICTSGQAIRAVHLRFRCSAASDSVCDKA
jgi:hypothetical protein